MAIGEYCTGLQHIGIPVGDVELSVRFYQGLGFVPDYHHHMIHENAELRVAFMRLHELVIELYQFPPEPPAGRNGAVDHIAINCRNIDALFEEVKAGGYRMLDGGVNSLPFYEGGVRFFTISGPDGEKIEFNEKG